MKVSAAQSEIETLLRMVEPFSETVLPILTDYKPEEEHAMNARLIKHYRFDIANNLHQFIRDAKAQLCICERLQEEYDRKAQDKVNAILNFLTYITFIIIPVQILTGVYGMNFRYMPELRWEH